MLSPLLWITGRKERKGSGVPFVHTLLCGQSLDQLAPPRPHSLWFAGNVSRSYDLCQRPLEAGISLPRFTSLPSILSSSWFCSSSCLNFTSSGTCTASGPRGKAWCSWACERECRVQAQPCNYIVPCVLTL